MRPSDQAETAAFRIGGKYNWKNQSERLVYLRALIRLWDTMPDEDVGIWERAHAYVHLVREAEAKLGQRAALQVNTTEMSEGAKGSATDGK